MNHHLNYSGKVGFKVSVKRTATAISLTVLAVCMALGLSSCGGTAKETKENQVKDDISKFLLQDAAFSDYNLEVDTFSISKRQTNIEDKTDFVWCDVTATGSAAKKPDDKFSCSIECQLTYGLYNDGWLLDTCTCDMVASSIKPLSPPPSKEFVEEKTAPPYAPGDGGVYSRVEVHDMVQISDTEVAYQVDLYHDRWGNTTITMTYKFGLQNGWGDGR